MCGSYSFDIPKQQAERESARKWGEWETANQAKESTRGVQGGAGCTEARRKTSRFGEAVRALLPEHCQQHSAGADVHVLPRPFPSRRLKQALAGAGATLRWASSWRQNVCRALEDASATLLFHPPCCQPPCGLAIPAFSAWCWKLSLCAPCPIRSSRLC